MLVFALALAVQVSDPADQNLARFGPLPRDVAAFIERRTGCNHFAGEFNGDRSARDHQVAKALRELRCDRLEADEARLRRRHLAKPQVPNALTASRDWQ